ncbi:MAG: tetratricopeptide repeat protein [Desulfobulbaceae bacterium]|nr:tetratricopeptide repeat protein [Desulfobulbaceae bacterium]
MTKKIKHSRGHLKGKKQVSGLQKVSSQQSILQQAQSLHKAGRFDQAETLYRQILLAEPNHPEALHFLGLLAHQLGRKEFALELLRKALNSRPDYVEAYYNLGMMLLVQGNTAEAAAIYRRLLTMRPNDAQVHNNLGIALKNQGALDAAEASFRKAITLKPDYAEALNNLGVALNDQGKPDLAVASFSKAITLKPDYIEAYYNLGNALKDQGKMGEAVASYRRALSLKPDYAEALNNLGTALKVQGLLNEAIESFRQAIALRPDYAYAYNNLGIAYLAQEKSDEAYANFQKAITLIPDYAEAHSNLGLALQAKGKLDEAIESFRDALSLKPDFFEAHSDLLFCLNYLDNQSVSRYLDEARLYGRKATAKVSVPYANWKCSLKSQRLSVGVISGDFCNHPVGYFLENLLANMDPEQIDLVAYPTHSKEDDLTARIRSRFVAWKPLVGMHDDTAARMIHNDGVHILLDLSGHTEHNRLPIFAWKPAPIQVSWLGYSATTGLTEIDYLLADPYVVPPQDDSHYTETVWRLPETYLCFSPPNTTVAVGPLPASKEGRITFGCFNNPTKMNDSVVALWSKVLHAAPGSCLLLKAGRFSNPTFCETTRKRFAAFDIEPDRLLLKGFVPNREEHLNAYNRVDIALDPFPYNGTTTSVEGLWMGVPFITRQGDRFISHVGESIAHNTGMSDWIAFDDDDYIAKAVAYAADLEKLARLRAGLRRQVLKSPVFDAKRFANHFKAALWGMWHRFEDGQ